METAIQQMNANIMINIYHNLPYTYNIVEEPQMYYWLKVKSEQKKAQVEKEVNLDIYTFSTHSV